MLPMLPLLPSTSSPPLTVLEIVNRNDIVRVLKQLALISPTIAMKIQMELRRILQGFTSVVEIMKLPMTIRKRENFGLDVYVTLGRTQDRQDSMKVSDVFDINPSFSLLEVYIAKLMVLCDPLYGGTAENMRAIVPLLDKLQKEINSKLSDSMKVAKSSTSVNLQIVQETNEILKMIFTP